VTTAIHTRADHLATARRYAANRQDWSIALRFDPHRRWYHRLAAEPDGEVWVLTWWPGQGTDIHDHGGSAGAFVVVAGALTERTFTADPGGGPLRSNDRVRSAGQGRSFGRRHIHQVTNNGVEPAISVHAYSPALREMTRYGVAYGQLVVTAVDTAGGDW
jgi:predicted metal-dependent enzyme (double-stranded beta helix superfamily)